MKAAEWIDRVKAAKGWPSDYKAAQELGITRGGMSQIRTGDSLTLSEETAIKVAAALGEKPEAVLLDQFAERVKDQTISATLHKVARSLCILCKVTSVVRRGPPGDVKKSHTPGQMLKSALFPLHFLGSPAYPA